MTRRRAGVFGVLATLGIVWFASPAPAADRGNDGQFDRRESSHFVLYQDVDIDERSGFHGSVRFEREVLRILEAGYDRLDKFLGLRPRRPIEVVVYDPDAFAAQFTGLFRFPAAGFYHGVIRVRGDTVASAQLERVLYHELVHAALDEAAPNYRYPAWVNEGLAEWFEMRSFGKRRLSTGELDALQRAAAQNALLPLRALSTPSLGHLDPNTARFAYLQSYAIFAWLANSHGDPAIERFASDLARSRNLDRTLRRVFRTDMRKLEQEFTRYLGG